MLADAVDSAPDLSVLKKYSRVISKRYPTKRRIPIDRINYMDLVTSPKKFRGKTLVIMEPTGSIRDKEFKNGSFSFTVPIKGMATSKYSAALVQFVLRSRKLVTEFSSGERTYSCGQDYCDQFVIAAKLSGRTADRVDQFGTVRRLPVFEIVEFADRFGYERR